MVPPSSDKVSSVSSYSGICSLLPGFVYGAFTRSGRLSQNRSTTVPLTCCSPYPRTSPGLGSYPFARHYSGNHCYFLFLRVLRCFSSPGSPCMAMVSLLPCTGGGLLRRVSPFRNLRVSGYLLLTAAYRSLSRLSSALSAKASTLRSYLLDLYTVQWSMPPWCHSSGLVCLAWQTLRFVACKNFV